MLFLSFSFYKKGSLTKMLQSPVVVDQEIYLNLTQQLNKAEETIASYRKEIAILTQEKTDCQNAAFRLESGAANKNDLAGELKSILAIRKKEMAGFESSLGKMRDEQNRLQQQYDQLSNLYRQTQDKTEQLQSQLGSLQSDKSTLEESLSQLSTQKEAELKRLREENGKIKSLIRDTERHNNLLQQGLSLLETNEWQLEQDVQRLANLLASQPDVNTPSQSEASRAIQRIQQTLREGTAITRQTKAVEPSSPHQIQGKPSDQQKK
jgi:chromosome segregation ATPase